MTLLTLPFKVDLSQVHLTDEQFYQICISNPDLNIERDAKEALIFMSPVGGDSGRREADYITDLNIWNRQTRGGFVFSSSTMFKLPGGGDRFKARRGAMPCALTNGVFHLREHSAYDGEKYSCWLLVESSMNN